MRVPAQGRWQIAALRRALRAPKRLVLRCLVVLVMVLVTLPAWAGAGEKYQCRYSKRVMSSCCCRAKHKLDKQADSSPQVRAPSCCDTLRQAASSVSASPRDPAPLALEANGATSLVPIATPGPARLLKLGAEARADARAGPGIFLRDCRLLT